MHSCSFYSDAHCYLISLTDSDGISGTLNLSNSASDGIFWNLITGCTALISDGTFNQKGNQKVIHSWDSLQSQRSHNTTCCKGLLASSPYVAIKHNWLLSSQHPLPFSKIQIAQLSVESAAPRTCSCRDLSYFKHMIKQTLKRLICLFLRILASLGIVMNPSLLSYYIHTHKLTTTTPNFLIQNIFTVKFVS